MAVLGTFATHWRIPNEKKMINVRTTVSMCGTSERIANDRQATMANIMKQKKKEKNNNNNDNFRMD